MAKNVLLVDDSSTMRKIISRSLRQAGLDFGEIYEAGDGQEALAVLEKESVDIVLSDINMAQPGPPPFEHETPRIYDNLMKILAGKDKPAARSRK